VRTVSENAAQAISLDSTISNTLAVAKRDVYTFTLGGTKYVDFDSQTYSSSANPTSNISLESDRADWRRRI